VHNSHTRDLWSRPGFSVCTLRPHRGFTRAVLQCGGISHSPHTLPTSHVPQSVLFSSRPHRDVVESLHAKLKANVRVVPLVGAKPASEWQWSRRANACPSCRCRATSALFHVTIELTLLLFLHCAPCRVRERGGHLSGSSATADQGVCVCERKESSRARVERPTVSSPCRHSEERRGCRR
jgi:hypothetical protein